MQHKNCVGNRVAWYGNAKGNCASPRRGKKATNVKENVDYIACNQQVPCVLCWNGNSVEQISVHNQKFVCSAPEACHIGFVAHKSYICQKCFNEYLVLWVDDDESHFILNWYLFIHGMGTVVDILPTFDWCSKLNPRIRIASNQQDFGILRRR